MSCLRCCPESEVRRMFHHLTPALSWEKREQDTRTLGAQHGAGESSAIPLLRALRPQRGGLTVARSVPDAGSGSSGGCRRANLPLLVQSTGASASGPSVYWQGFGRYRGTWVLSRSVDRGRCTTLR